MSPTARARQLAQRHLDGTLAPQDHAELDALLRSCPEAADAFAEATRVDAALTDHFAQQAAVGREGEVLRRLASPPRRWAARLALAACLLLALGGLALWLTWPAGPSVEEGQVVIDGDEWRAEGPARVRLADGSRLDLADGSRVVLRWRHVELRKGEGVFDVAPGDEVFEVVTPAGRARVLGTAFRVSLIEEEDEMNNRGVVLAVAVWSGLVQVEFAGDTYRLGAGQARAFGRGDGDRERRPDIRRGTLDNFADGKLKLKGGDRREGETFTVPADAKVTVDGKPGKLAGLPEGALVAIELGKKGEVVAVSVTGPSRALVIKSASMDEVTFDVRGRREGVRDEVKFPLKDIAVTVDGKPGKADDLRAGDRVTVTMRADLKGLVSIAKGRAERGGREPDGGRGRRWQRGLVAGVDAKKETVSLKGEREDRVLELAKGAKVLVNGREAKLEDVKAGAVITFLLGDDGKATRIQVVGRRGDGAGRPERGPGGAFKRADAKAGTIVVQMGREPFAREYALADTFKVVEGDKEIKLDELKPGATVALTLSRDGKVTQVSVAKPRGERRRGDGE